MWLGPVQADAGGRRGDGAQARARLDHWGLLWPGHLEWREKLTIGHFRCFVQLCNWRVCSVELKSFKWQTGWLHLNCSKQVKCHIHCTSIRKSDPIHFNRTWHRSGNYLFTCIVGGRTCEFGKLELMMSSPRQLPNPLMLLAPSPNVMLQFIPFPSFLKENGLIKCFT